jgi:hypothetical protein
MSKCANYISTIFLVAIIVFNFSLVSCEYKAPEPAYKKDTILPAITTTGANTFGCKLNGSYWLAVPNKSFQTSYSKGAISITFDKSGDNKWGSIVIASFDNQISTTGMYYFSKKMHGNYFETGKIYRTSDTTTFGYLNVLRLDSVNRIISGTFEFSPENLSLTPSKVYLTEGRFDLKY